MGGIVGWLGILVLIMILERFIKGFHVRETMDPWADIRNMTPDEYDAYVQNHVEHKRFVNDFVLTRAIFPIEANRVRIREGYEVKKVTDLDAEVMFNITVAVSAEKIWDMLIAFIESMGDVCQVQVLDFENADDARLYVADHQEINTVIEIFAQHKDMIINNGTMNIVIHRMDFKQSVHLGYHKHFFIEVDKAAPVLELLQSFGIIEDKMFWPFYKSWTINLNEWAGTGQLKAMVHKFQKIKVFTWPLEADAGL